MKRLMLLQCVILFLVVHGCNNCDRNSAMKTPDLTPESARNAIIAMLSDPETDKSFPPGTHELFQYLHKNEYIDKLRRENINRTEGATIIGDWTGDLMHLTFTTSFSNNAHRYIINGVFTMEPNGSWNARIKNISVHRLPEKQGGKGEEKDAM